MISKWHWSRSVETIPYEYDRDKKVLTVTVNIGLFDRRKHGCCPIQSQDFMTPYSEAVNPNHSLVTWFSVAREKLGRSALQSVLIVGHLAEQIGRKDFRKPYGFPYACLPLLFYMLSKSQTHRVCVCCQSIVGLPSARQAYSVLKGLNPLRFNEQN